MVIHQFLFISRMFSNILNTCLALSLPIIPFNHSKSSPLTICSLKTNPKRLERIIKIGGSAKIVKKAVAAPNLSGSFLLSVINDSLNNFIRVFTFKGLIDMNEFIILRINTGNCYAIWYENKFHEIQLLMAAGFIIAFK